MLVTTLIICLLIACLISGFLHLRCIEKTSEIKSQYALQSRKVNNLKEKISGRHRRPTPPNSTEELYEIHEAEKGELSELEGRLTSREHSRTIWLRLATSLFTITFFLVIWPIVEVSHITPFLAILALLLIIWIIFATFARKGERFVTLDPRLDTVAAGRLAK